MFLPHFDVFCFSIPEQTHGNMESICPISNSVNSGFVPQHSNPTLTTLRVRRVLNTVNTNKRIRIFSAEMDVYYSSFFVEYPPNPIASCEFKPFWFKNQARLSTHLCGGE